MYYTIYKTTNIVDGKFYLGMHKTKRLDDRYIGSGKRLKRAIVKHGREAFQCEILFVFDNPEEMYAKEIELITEDLVKDPQCYNLTVGGWGGNRLREGSISWSTDHLALMTVRARLRTINDPERRKRLAEDGRRYLEIINTSGNKDYATFRGRTHTEDTKRKMSESAKLNLSSGKKNNMQGRMWITDGVTNQAISTDDDIPDGWRRGRVMK